MGRKYAIRNQAGLHFVTFTVINWVDLFIRDEYRELIIDSLKHCHQHKGLKIHAYTIMPSHIHLILSATSGYNLSDIIRDYKRFTSRHLIDLIKMNPKESRRGWLLWMFRQAGKSNPRNSKFQLWQQHNHPIELNSNTMLNQRLQYIHNNPVSAGFVDDPCSWIWSSSAAYYRDEVGKLQLSLIEL